MKNQDFNCSLTTNVTAEEAMAAISSVPDWWVTNFEGASQKLGDVFTARVCETFVTFNITGLSPIPKLCGRWSTATRRQRLPACANCSSIGGGGLASHQAEDARFAAHTTGTSTSPGPSCHVMKLFDR